MKQDDEKVPSKFNVQDAKGVWKTTLGYPEAPKERRLPR